LIKKAAVTGEFIPIIHSGRLTQQYINRPSFHFILKRRRFPTIPAYEMTINKSQGQTFDHMEIYSYESVFAHGQLYVALSKSKNSQLKLFVNGHELHENLLKSDANLPNTLDQNIVFREIFHFQ